MAVAGFDPAEYSGQQPAGFATSATRAGVSTFKLRQQTGHASEPMLSRYVRDGETFSMGTPPGFFFSDSGGIAALPSPPYFEAIFRSRHKPSLSLLRNCSIGTRLAAPAGQASRRAEDGVMKSPTIECLGPPPERHADRVTGDMIRFLITERVGTQTRIEAELVRSFGKRDGNPKAQAKLVERVKSAGGKTLLSVLLCPGKRGRYSLAIYDWVGFDPERNVTIQGSDVPPLKPWLACWLTLFSALDGKRDSATGAFLLVTHHALSRLAQRLGAREPDDAS
jgi:hypothetical protein